MSVTTTTTAILMAKQPVPGRVKTRLIDGDGGNSEPDKAAGRGASLDADAAARIAGAMLHCIASRLYRIFDGKLIVAGSPDDVDYAALGLEDLAACDRRDASALRLVGQGGGNLGQRMVRVWQKLDPDAPVAFFGIDSPDVPATYLRQLRRALQDVSADARSGTATARSSSGVDVAIGPTDDGGYWTIAARRYEPSILQGITWGGPAVYSDTIRIAREERGLSVLELPAWYDVDVPADVLALAARIRADDVEPELATLAAALDRICCG